MQYVASQDFSKPCCATITILAFDSYNTHYFMVAMIKNTRLHPLKHFANVKFNNYLLNVLKMLNSRCSGL